MKVGALACAVTVVGSAVFACERPAIALADQIDPASLLVLTIDPACLTHPEDSGILFADIARQLVEAHLALDPDRSHAAVHEQVVEFFVAQILEPTSPSAK